MGSWGMRRSPAATDTAQAVLVTPWNVAMALDGIIGGLLLQSSGVTAVAVSAAALQGPVFKLGPALGGRADRR
ncbi:hypothetical protein [Streptomyces sp. NPDC056323]|uniref:hypothetical protein n=1 Tax=Streptomyces sp. NPDC056323 TaxID=3345784 RepID=UPI0035E1FC97